MLKNKTRLMSIVALTIIMTMVFAYTTGFKSDAAVLQDPVLTNGIVTVNGTQVQGVDVYMDNLPISEDYELYAEVGDIVSAIGGSYSVSGNDITISANGITIVTSVYDGDPDVAAKMFINNVATLNDQPPKMIDDVIMFPVAYLFSNLSCNVTTDMNTGNIVIAYDPNVDFSIGPEGFGGGTQGAFGCKDANGNIVEPTVIWVTSLNDDPTNVQPGTLRWAINQRYPRVIRFSVAGTINLKSELLLNGGNNLEKYVYGVSGFSTQSFVTIDGYSAPGEGITLKGGSISIRGGVRNDNYLNLTDGSGNPYVLGQNCFSRVEEVVVRYIRFRLGDEGLRGSYPTGGGGADCISLDGYATNVLVDHCSVSWCGDELIGILTAKNVTVQWSILSEPLGDTGDKLLKTPIANRMHPYGANHAFGLNSSGMSLSVHHNLFAHGRLRMPQFESNDAHYNQGFNVMAEVVNNVIFDYSDNGSRYTIGSDVASGRTDAAQIGATKFYYQYINNKYMNSTASYPEILAELTSVKVSSTELTTAQRLTSQTKAYLSGNLGPNRTSLTANEWDVARIKATAHGVSSLTKIDSVSGTNATAIKATRSTTPLFTSNVTTQSANDAYTLVLKYAGASKRYDAVDKRIINDVLTLKYYTAGYFGAAGVYSTTFPWSMYQTAYNTFSNLTTTANNALYINGSSANPIYPNLKDPTNSGSASLGSTYKHTGFVTADFLGSTTTFWTSSSQAGYAFRNHANSATTGTYFKIVYKTASPLACLQSQMQVGGYPVLQTGNADLEQVIVSGGTMTSAFNDAVTTYNVLITTAQYNALASGSTAPITVKPVAKKTNATITVNGTSVSSGNTVSNITLGADKAINIVVTGSDGIAQTYVINFVK